MTKLDAKALALSLGIIWGALMLLLGIINMFSSWGSGISAVMGTLYIGYAPTPAGAIIGGLWGFADAAIGGFLIAWLYNKLLKN